MLIDQFSMKGKWMLSKLKQLFIAIRFSERIREKANCSSDTLLNCFLMR